MDLAVIIPTYNRSDYLKVLLSQLNDQTSNIEFIVVVVDDGSSDGTSEMVKKNFPLFHLVKGEGNWWFTRSLNEGIKYSERFSPQMILTLNDDIEIPQNYIESLVFALKKVGKNSIIGSCSFTKSLPHKLTFSGVKEIRKWRLKDIPYYKSFQIILPGSITGIFESRLLPTRGTLIPLNIIKTLDYFDESMPQYGSDYDFILRAGKFGNKVFISHDSYLFEYEKLTGKGSPLLRENFFIYHKNLFNKFSKSHISKDLKIIFRHYKTIFLPLTLLIYFIGIYKTYFKYKVSNKIRN